MASNNPQTTSLPPEAPTPDDLDESTSGDSSSDDDLENPNIDHQNPSVENQPLPSPSSPEPPAKRQKIAPEQSADPVPKMEQVLHNGTAVNGALNPSSTPSSPTPVSSIKPHVFYFTAQQVRMKNKKLPKGYSFVPYNKVPNVPFAAPSTSSGSVYGDSAVGKRKRKKKALDVEPSPVSAPKRQKTDSKKGKKKKTNAERQQRAQEQTARQRQREKEKQLQDQALQSQNLDTGSRIAILQAKLEFLQKAKKAALAAGSTSAKKTSGKKSSGKKTSKVPKTPKPKKAPKTPKTKPASVIIPSTNYPSHLTSTPTTTQNNNGRTSSRKIRKPAKLEDNFSDSPDFVRHCREVLDYLAKQQNYPIFNQPVDWERLNIPTYPNIIKYPMDLGTVRTKLLSSQYASSDAFAADVRLVWTNATTFNPPANFVHIVAKKLSEQFETKYAKSIAKMSRVKPPSKVTPGHKGRKTVPASQVDQLRNEFASQIAALKEQVSSQGRPRTTKPKPEVELTTREKQQLKSDIFKLPSNKLSPLVEIIQRENPNNGSEDDDGLEFDINQLSTSTLRELQRYVKKQLIAKKRNQQRFTPGRGSTPGRISSPGPTTPLPSLPPMHTAPPARSILASPPALEARTPARIPPTAPSTAASVVPVNKPPAAEPKPVITKKEFTDDDDSSSSSSDSSSDDSDSEEDESSTPKVKNEVKPSTEAAVPVPSVAPVATVAPVKAPVVPVTTHASSVTTPSAPVAPAVAPAASFGDPGAFSASITEMQAPPVISEPEKTPQTLQSNFNPSAWSGLVSQAPKVPVAKPTPSTNSNGKDVMWANFQSKDQEMKEKAKQKADQQARIEEENARKAAEKAAEIEAEQARQRAEAEQAAKMAEEEAKKRAEEERLAEQRRREEEARQEETRRQEEEEHEPVNFGTGAAMDELQSLLDA